VGFSASSYEQWHQKIEPGTRVLLYKDHPVNAIIGEAIVQDNVFIPLEDLPEHNQQRLLTSGGKVADYALPLRVTYLYSQRHYIAQDQLSALADAKRYNGWIPIDNETYQALTQPNTAELAGDGDHNHDTRV